MAAREKGKTGKGKDQDGEREEVPRQMTLTSLASVGTVARGDTGRPSAGSRRTKEAHLWPQAFETVATVVGR